jgi:hypothetical protein
VSAVGVVLVNALPLVLGFSRCLPSSTAGKSYPD